MTSATTREHDVDQSTLPACPDWCTYRELYPEDDHGYDNESAVDDATRQRSHVSGRTGHYLVQTEYNRAGAVTLAPIEICTPCGCRDLTAGEARQQAAGLLAVAGQLDAITRSATAPRIDQVEDELGAAGFTINDDLSMHIRRLRGQTDDEWEYIVREMTSWYEGFSAGLLAARKPTAATS